MTGARRAALFTHRGGVWGTAVVALAAVTLVMRSLRGVLGPAHVALIYLIVVLMGSAAAGRALGFTLAGAAFLAFNVLFLPPYGTLVIANPLDWLVLVAFLITSLIAAQLLTRAQARAEEARARAAEVERLSTLGVETLNAVHAEDALQAIAEVIRSTLCVDRCQVYVRRTPADEPALAASAGGGADAPSTAAARSGATNGGESLLAWVCAHGVAAAERLDGTLHVQAHTADGTASAQPVTWSGFDGVRVLIAPLRVRDRIVGALRVVSQAGLQLAPQQHRFLDALTYYAALGAERARLTAEAAEVETMREADRLKNALLAAVSHDLRTPLTTIKALADDVAERGAAPGDPRARSIEEEADHLTAFVGDLLDLSRLSGGALRLDVAVNAAEDLIGAAIARTAGVMGAHPLAVVQSPHAPRHAPVEEPTHRPMHHPLHHPLQLGTFDFVHALHALVNLLENAAKYAPPGTPIDLSVHRDGASLVFTVADRGPGIAPSERETIFQPFYRPAGVAPDVRGAGLGLAIARGLATAQGGTVYYEPRTGGGSLFHLVLPAAERSTDILSKL